MQVKALIIRIIAAFNGFIQTNPDSIFLDDAVVNYRPGKTTLNSKNWLQQTAEKAGEFEGGIGRDQADAVLRRISDRLMQGFTIQVGDIAGLKATKVIDIGTTKDQGKFLSRMAMFWHGLARRNLQQTKRTFVLL